MGRISLSQWVIKVVVETLEDLLKYVDNSIICQNQTICTRVSALGNGNVGNPQVVYLTMVTLVTMVTVVTISTLFTVITWGIPSHPGNFEVTRKGQIFGNPARIVSLFVHFIA